MIGDRLRRLPCSKSTYTHKIRAAGAAAGVGRECEYRTTLSRKKTMLYRRRTRTRTHHQWQLVLRFSRPRKHQSKARVPVLIIAVGLRSLNKIFSLK
eukprot:scaffold4926_cov15-Prasinocladus_malaysianus.AAC.1